MLAELEKKNDTDVCGEKCILVLYPSNMKHEAAISVAACRQNAIVWPIC